MLIEGQSPFSFFFTGRGSALFFFSFEFLLMNFDFLLIPQQLTWFNPGMIFKSSAEMRNG